MSSVRSVSDVLSEMFGNVQNIVRAEIQLATTEVRDELRSSRSASVLFAVGALLGCLGAFFMLLCMVEVLGFLIPPWAAALIVGALLALVAAVTVNVAARRLRHNSALLPRTVASLKENVEWAKPPGK
jgi:sterol desaturase/sphingolipid hydroxylase (fatty acid hydroxylase superfamily)